MIIIIENRSESHVSLSEPELQFSRQEPELQSGEAEQEPELQSSEAEQEPELQSTGEERDYVQRIELLPEQG